MTVATAPREFLELAGQRLAYRVSGRRDGRPIVLLHGWGGSLDAFVAVQGCLESDYQVIAFDLPGFGQSPAPATSWGSWEYAQLVNRALDSLGQARVSVLGHSFGGKIGILLTVRMPELVDRLVLVNSAGLRPPPSARRQARVVGFKLARRIAGQGPLARWLSQRLGSADYRAAGPLRPTLVRVVNEDLRPLLPQVKVPTLIIWGDQDRETPLADAVIMEREIPDAGLVVFPGAGHFSYLDDLPRFCRVAGHFLGT